MVEMPWVMWVDRDALSISLIIDPFFTITHIYSFDFNQALEAAQRAIQRAKNVHLFDTLHLYRKNNVFFHTYCKRLALLNKHNRIFNYFHNLHHWCALVPFAQSSFRKYKSGQHPLGECLVLPPIEEGGPLGLLLHYHGNYHSSTDNRKFSHRVTLHNGDKQDVRLMVKIEETETLIDPLDFRYQNGAFISPAPSFYISALGVYWSVLSRRTL